MKKCNICQEEKPLTEFYKEAKMPDGHRKSCKTCKNKTTAEWRKKNKDRYNKYMRQKNKQHYFKYRLYRYDLTVGQHAEMVKAQNNKCAICNCEQTGKRPLAVDHCHTTGTVRGLLCYNCNRGMHYIDDATFLAKALLYKTNK